MNKPAAGDEIDSLAEHLRQLVVHGRARRDEVVQGMRELTPNRIVELTHWAEGTLDNSPSLTVVEAALVFGMQKQLRLRSGESPVQAGLFVATLVSSVRDRVLDGGVFVSPDTSGAVPAV
ncbi:hypothetical protein A2424_06140 [Candidatus Peribacteria bacterium RIFOXYC1_FULL_54_13]|nr:MAG: hypothetical protein UY85_C0028G0009 [Candidatus Peribacteria bacterium GW2011_GWB1_54_5]KKW40212.1 MAG: hypothetical protein UY87_C0026G0005 [Candidatus Peribacteria bacterium GW2011_GWC2_54_8]KKW43089.1 MAG: hypothetical protein UY90_C0031G0007 [Candidatus Peregrinibacteria bacterium GW2011_GWA2_54_9]OGJ72117.1 MAG: hypothetical protein A2198_04595 [Candidatus Peribacteria bacterium RIFOXYA1_FULL_56_14]OGJ74131.1 MAG: hypothetical protein A2217_00615 [Candidatus Peribacteria bacterium